MLDHLLARGRREGSVSAEGSTGGEVVSRATVDSHLAVSGLERVQVSLPVAGVGYRTLAYLIDALLLFLGWTAGYFVLSLLVSDLLGLFQGLSAVVQAVALIALFATQWLYWICCEALWRGQTVGKRLLGIRVVRLDGSPVTAYESAVRNLLRVVDFLPALYGVGVLSMLVTEQHRRLGDLVAGTLLIREERINLERYTVPAAGDIAPVPGGALPAAELELLLAFLERAPTLAPGARESLTRAFLDRYAAHLAEPERASAAAHPAQAEALLRARL